MVPLSAQVCKWTLANLMLGETLLWTCIPCKGWGGGTNTPSHFMFLKPEISISLMGHLTRNENFCTITHQWHLIRKLILAMQSTLTKLKTSKNLEDFVAAGFKFLCYFGEILLYLWLNSSLPCTFNKLLYIPFKLEETVINFRSKQCKSWYKNCN